VTVQWPTRTAVFVNQAQVELRIGVPTLGQWLPIAQRFKKIPRVVGRKTFVETCKGGGGK